MRYWTLVTIMFILLGTVGAVNSSLIDTTKPPSNTDDYPMMIVDGIALGFTDNPSSISEYFIVGFLAICAIAIYVMVRNSLRRNKN